MNKIPVNSTFPDTLPKFSICTEPLIEAKSFVCEHFYYNNKIEGATNVCMLRKSVIDRLKEAEKSLSDGYIFKIYDGWRPFKVQKSLYDDYRNKIKKSLPYLHDEELDSMTKLFVSPPVWDKTFGPVHATGGSVDLTIIDKDGNELNMGTEFDCFENSANTNYFELDDIDEEVRQNRRVLYSAMINAGFTNLPTEWWHYDFGNKFWAYYTGEPAIYNCIFERDDFYENN